ncbi:eukaryotic translation initiation factor 3 subunit M [Thecamonas trahens ATCC 50062]|uniref:Eukaryotic translation initiation factor 3 subunit M n=1 Tax=Thecamonas trahens ATCC 50062 TaxID=461836 RepID=A0A0L0DNM1_THETB|nr:eukaryotic translation initiation factor 3 subunit M [Thecamonas trahens ATCC 50062]KNC53917.1 eukaryotic translation initiation factor 3 subunit M [Thecamonas trahens ATCC 50062]|eukprot:XP_013754123.1 eukaryotic translation initiation factor 3 subunit M [Thecamonas trahens ATCC 50062]
MVYNKLPSGLELRFDTLMKMISLALESSKLPLIKPHLLNFGKLVAAAFADVPVAKKRAGLQLAAKALSSVGARADAAELRFMLLDTYDNDDASSVTEVESVVLQVVSEALDMNNVFQFDHLLELKAVAAFATHANPQYVLVHQLLSVFVNGFVTDYTALYDSSAEAKDVVDNMLGLSHERNVEKMRLLSLTSLAANTEIIPYSLVSATLDVAPEDVERWCIKISKAKLARVRMDQASKVIHISRATQRVFEHSHWELLREKLSVWAKATRAMVDVVQNNKSG